MVERTADEQRSRFGTRLLCTTSTDANGGFSWIKKTVLEQFENAHSSALIQCTPQKDHLILQDDGNKKNNVVKPEITITWRQTLDKRIDGPSLF